jgi:hypothetical protein
MKIVLPPTEPDNDRSFQRRLASENPLLGSTQQPMTPIPKFSGARFWMLGFRRCAARRPIAGTAGQVNSLKNPLDRPIGGSGHWMGSVWTSGGPLREVPSFGIPSSRSGSEHPSQPGDLRNGSVENSGFQCRCTIPSRLADWPSLPVDNI